MDMVAVASKRRERLEDSLVVARDIRWFLDVVAEVVPEPSGTLIYSNGYNVVSLGQLLPRLDFVHPGTCRLFPQVPSPKVVLFHGNPTTEHDVR